MLLCERIDRLPADEVARRHPHRAHRAVVDRVGIAVVAVIVAPDATARVVRAASDASVRSQRIAVPPVKF